MIKNSEYQRRMCQARTVRPVYVKLESIALVRKVDSNHAKKRQPLARTAFLTFVKVAVQIPACIFRLCRET